MVPKNTRKVRAGTHFPQGATPVGDGVNFALYSKHADGVDLLLFNDPLDASPTDMITLTNRTNFIWHCMVEGLAPGQLYGYRVRGPYQPQYGLRFNPNRLLVDPYARAITGKFVPGRLHLGYDPSSPLLDLSFNTRGNAAGAPKCVVVYDSFDWAGDVSPHTPMRDTIIYELHLKGFTARGSAGVKQPGTFTGLIEKIPYLKSLGITAVEFLPVHHCHDDDFLINRGLLNYWGYNTLGYFAPDSRFGSGSMPGCQVREFKEMVKALHRAGLEVILDVVYNHTCEGSELGPTLSWRGIDNPTYYKLHSEKRYYLDYSGCGNSLNFDEFQVVRMVMDSLRYWVEVMHVDGFRFDLAPVLGRSRGIFDRNSGFFMAVHQEPVISRVKLIAEPWDITRENYQAGNFPVDWAEWNGKYRDCIRKYVKGDPGMLAETGYRLSGSSDLYGDDGRSPLHSINFITCHDGFTLNDLVSFEKKHNEANLDCNTDGSDYNNSFNCGVEGETADPAVNAFRKKFIKNFLAILMISQGVPMILGGDEFRRTQKGNNNAYCQDNEISYFDWDLAGKNQDLVNYVRRLTALRKRFPHFRLGRFFTGQDRDLDTMKDINWYSSDLNPPGWNLPEQRFLAYLIEGKELAEATASEKESDILVILNAHQEEILFPLPAGRTGSACRRLVDTSLPEGEDVPEDPEGQALACQDSYLVAPQSVVVLIRKDR
ncbi:MAG: glycogen debranching protein GlgX [Peptococcaceae bacterium]|nr:glycogen debranching protein GlgX [Peptococcaceae bacterium]